MAFTASERTFAIEGAVTDATNLNGAVGVHKVGDYAYVACRDADALAIVDVSDPANPSITGFVSSGTQLSSARDVVKDGDYAYVAADNDNAVTVVDVSDPANPSITGSFASLSDLEGVRGVDKDGNYVYAAAFNADALTVVDVSDPANPSLAGTVSTTDLNGAFDVIKDGDYAYVAADQADALTVVDVSTPSSPSVTGTVSSTDLDGARGVDKDGSLVYVAAFTADALTVVDVSTPSSPSVTGTVSDATDLQDAQNVSKAGDNAYVAAEAADAVTGVDVSTPSSPSVTGTVSRSASLDGAFDVDEDNGLVYTAVRVSDALTVVDPREPVAGDWILEEGSTADVFAGSVDRKTPVTGREWTASLYIEASGTGESTFLVWAHDTEASLGNGYGVGVRDVSGTLKTQLVRFSSGSPTVIDETTTLPTAGEWITVTVTHEPDGTITATLESTQGTITLTGTDTNLLDADGRYNHHGTGYWGPGGNPGNAVDHWTQFINVVEDWESGDLADWNGDTTGFTVDETAPVSQPTNSLKVNDDNSYTIYSTDADGTRKPSVGDVQEILLWLDDETAARDGGLRFYWATDHNAASSPSNGYEVEVDAFNADLSQDDEIQIVKHSGGGATNLATTTLGVGAIPRNAWILLRIEHQSDGTLTAQLYDDSGGLLGTASATDSEHITDGVYDQTHVAIRSSIRVNRVDAWRIR